MLSLVVVVVAVVVVAYKRTPQMLCHKFEALARRRLWRHRRRRRRRLQRWPRHWRRHALMKINDWRTQQQQEQRRDCTQCASPVCGWSHWRISMRCAQIIHKLHSILIKRKMYEQESVKRGMKRREERGEWREAMKNVAEIRSLRKACN